MYFIGSPVVICIVIQMMLKCLHLNGMQNYIFVPPCSCRVEHSKDGRTMDRSLSRLVLREKEEEKERERDTSFLTS
jgi:hypothetical protein